MNRADIVAAETCLFEAWRAPEVSDVGGWQVRAATGGYRRLNSVWTANFDGSLDVADAVATTQAYYGDHKMPARFMVLEVAEPAELDQELAARGYAVSGSCVTLARGVGNRQAPEGVEAVAAASDAWLALYRGSVSAERQHELRGALARLPADRIFCTAHDGGIAAATGLGVRWRDIVGVECMFTRDDARGRGLAGKILASIEAWAATIGARRLVVATGEENQAARRLYEKAGYAPLSRYHYRERA
jgi:N-acetylglutamate synthase